MNAIEQRFSHAEAVAQYLSAETGRPWVVMDSRAKDRYAFGCDFIVMLEGQTQMILIRNPLPENPDAPLWAFSTSCGDRWAAAGSSLLEVMQTPGVVERMSGRPGPSLARDWREARRSAAQQAQPYAVDAREANRHGYARRVAEREAKPWSFSIFGLRITIE